MKEEPLALRETPYYKNQTDYSNVPAIVPSKATDAVMSHDDTPLMVAVALRLLPFVALDVDVEEVDVEDWREDMVEGDWERDVDSDSEDAVSVLELGLVDDGGEAREMGPGVVVFGAPTTWPLPIKYAGGPLYKVGSTREPKP